MEGITSNYKGVYLNTVHNMLSFSLFSLIEQGKITQLGTLSIEDRFLDIDKLGPAGNKVPVLLTCRGTLIKKDLPTFGG